MAKSRDRQAVEDLVMQYRIERASRWMGKIGLLIFALAAVSGQKVSVLDVSAEPQNDFGGAGALSTAIDYLLFGQML